MEQVKEQLELARILSAGSYFKNDQDEPKFNGAYSGNNLTKMKDEVYVINFHDYESVRTH